ncbi:MAG: hypothetical protein AAF762_06470 [Pseudomonadota bacterium]
MQLIKRGYKGIELLVELNLDRAIALAVLFGALFFAAFVGTP